MSAADWVDLLDPSEAEIREHAPEPLRPETVDQLLRPAEPDAGGVRPTLRSEGDYIFGLLLVAVAVPEEDRVFYQEIDLVLTRDRVVTIRKTPSGEQPFDPTNVHQVCAAEKDATPPGMVAYHLIDEIAERYLDLLDTIDDEIDELEERIDELPPHETRTRLSELRRDLLHIRKTLSPTRDAVRSVSDGRVDLEGRALFTREVFPREVELRFASAYDKLLRASEASEYARDLLAAARDYHQARIAIDQNEVTKKLTAIASMVLIPTFIVGLYGQNFRHMPELHWRHGYAWSWALILGTTLLQYIYFRRKRWL